MKRIIIITMLLFSKTLFAQKSDNFKSDSLEKILVGVWEIDKIIDKDGNQVSTIKRSMKGSPIGDEIEIKATGPKMTLTSDYNYELEFTPKNIDRGRWFLTSKNTLIFQLITKKGSSSFEMLKTAAEMFGKTLKYDSEGNIIEDNPNSIVALEKDKLILQYEKEYFQVYRKIK